MRFWCIVWELFDGRLIFEAAFRHFIFPARHRSLVGPNDSKVWAAWHGSECPLWFALGPGGTSTLSEGQGCGGLLRASGAPGPRSAHFTTGPAPAPQCQHKLGLLGFRELRKDDGNRGGRGGAAQALASEVLATGQRRPAVGK